MTFLRRLLGITPERYRLEALVRSRSIEILDKSVPSAHIICDLDKTYVETEFESWVKMARIPFERPHEKITVPGASEVLLAVRSEVGHRPDAAPLTGLHFVSSSPPQLRSALEGKLVLDQLDWTTDTFKNQSYNIRMARIDLLRHHIAYKTKAILDIAATTAPGSVLWMVGDNAEYDGFIYCGVKLFVEGLVDVKGFAGWLSAAKVEPAVIQQVVEGTEWVQNHNLKVGGIFIRRLPNYQVVRQRPFTDEIFMFDSWFQVAWIWLCCGLIKSAELWDLTRAFHNIHGVPLEHIAWCLEQQTHTAELSSSLKNAALDVLRRLRQNQVGSKRCLVWDLPTANPSISKVLSSSDIIGYANSWYESIELARSYRNK